MFVNILDGIKVVDVTAWAFVPSAAGVLAHWGADVVKVESTTAPDPMRRGNLEPGRSAPGFKHYSRGKKSVAINLAIPGGSGIDLPPGRRRRRVRDELPAGDPAQAEDGR